VWYFWGTLVVINFGTVFSLHIKYVYQRGDTYYFQRKIPNDLQERYGSKSHIKENLKTVDPVEVARKVKDLNRKYEAIWEALRRDPSACPDSVRENAKLLLERHGLKPQPAANDQILLERFYDVLMDKEYHYTGGDVELADQVSIEDYLEPVEVEALRLLNDKPKLLLSDARDVYLEGHEKRNDEKFYNDSFRAWGRFIDAVGNKPFEAVTREDANSYVRKLLDQRLKTGTVRRMIVPLKAGFNTVIVEKEIHRTNPFERLRIPGFGEDADRRESFTPQELSTLKAACIDKNDDIRWAIAMLTDLGARLGEVLGLALTDIHLEGPVPYVHFQPHPWRSLKTKASRRKVPLVGTSLWAAQRIIANAQAGQKFAFPRYICNNRCRADSAAASINSWIKSRGVDKTTHELRHSIRDRLRNVNCPRPEIEQIGGWAAPSAGDNYGHGHALLVLHGWMLKIVEG